MVLSQKGGKTKSINKRRYREKKAFERKRKLDEQKTNSRDSYINFKS